MKRQFAWGLVVAALGMQAGRADACQIAVSEPKDLNPDAGADSEAPTLTDVTVFELTRGVGPRCVDGLQGASTCDDSGRLVLEVSAGDDSTPAEELGYRLEVVQGSLAEDLTFPEEVVGMVHGRLSFVWDDGATDAQEPFSFTLAVRAVDGAGNESMPVEVEIRSAGTADAGDNGCNEEADPGGGCSVRNTEGWPNIGWLTAGIVAAYLVRRNSRVR